MSWKMGDDYRRDQSVTQSLDPLPRSYGQLHLLQLSFWCWCLSVVLIQGLLMLLFTVPVKGNMSVSQLSLCLLSLVSLNGLQIRPISTLSCPVSELTFNLQCWKRTLDILRVFTLCVFCFILFECDFFFFWLWLRLHIEWNKATQDFFRGKTMFHDEMLEL